MTINTKHIQKFIFLFKMETCYYWDQLLPFSEDKKLLHWLYCPNYNCENLWSKFLNICLIIKAKNNLIENYLIRPRRNSSELTCRPEISGRRETSLQSLVSYAIMRHFLHTLAIRHISRCDRYEKMLSRTLSGNFSIVWKTNLHW